MFAVGCSSSKKKLPSRRPPAYRGKLERVLVVYENEDECAGYLGRKFVDGFLARLAESLSARGVDLEAVRTRKSDLDPNVPIREAANRFHPGQALYFGLTRVVNRSGRTSPQELHPRSHEATLTFTFSLVDVSRNEVVWRGEVNYFVVPESYAVADQFVKQLGEAGFLTGF
jgi:hypothetical protein